MKVFVCQHEGSKYCKTPYIIPLIKQKHGSTDGLSALAVPFTYDPNIVISDSKIKALEVWLKSTEDGLVEIPIGEVSKDIFLAIVHSEDLASHQCKK